MRTDEILNPFKAAEARRQAKHLDDVLNDMKEDGDLHGSNVSLTWAIEEVPMGYTHLLKPVLDKHKETILFRLLSRLKYELENDDLGRYTPELVDALTRAGLDWPELNAIRKSIHSHTNKRSLDEDDEDDDVAALQQERLDMIEEVIDAMTNGGSGRTFGAAKDTVQSLDRIGEDMLGDEMYRQKASIIANLVDMFFTSDRRTLESLMQLIEYSPHHIKELSNLPDSIMQIVEKEFDDRARHHGLAKTLEDVDALSDNGFDREYLMSDLREYKLSGFVRTYGIGAYSTVRELGLDLAAMIELGVDKEELIPIVEKRKTTIIKTLLVGMKNRGYHDVNTLMSALEDLGVDWSEFNAIRKSLGSLNTLG